MSNLKTALIIPDTHVPYHDKRAYDLMLKVAKDQKRIDEIVILGDFGDYYAVSSHAKDPDLESLLEYEVNEVNKKLDQLDKLFPRAKKVFIEGNHENRLTRYVRDKAPELFGLVDSPSLLKIKERKNWSWIEYGPRQKYRVLKSKLYARHEPMGGGKHCAAGTVDKAGHSVIFGHVHRIQEFQSVDIDDRNHRGITCGWLGEKKHKVYEYVKNHHQWALGFSLVKVFPDKSFHNQTLHIINYRCVYGNKVYKG